MHSPWRAKLCFCLCWLFDHSPLRVGGELEASEYAFLPLLAFATRHCELEASEYAFLPLLAFATLHCELEASNFIFLPFCTFFLFFFFAQCLELISCTVG